MLAWKLLNVAYSLRVSNAYFPNLYIEGGLDPREEEVEDYTCQFLGLPMLLRECGSTLLATLKLLLVSYSC